MLFHKGITVPISPSKHKAPRKRIDKKERFLIRKLLRLLQVEALNAK